MQLLAADLVRLRQTLYNRHNDAFVSSMAIWCPTLQGLCLCGEVVCMQTWATCVCGRSYKDRFLFAQSSQMISTRYILVMTRVSDMRQRSQLIVNSATLYAAPPGINS